MRAKLEQQAIARVRQSYEAFNRGDFDAAVQFLHPEVELYRVAGLPPVIGSDAVRQWAEPDAMLDARFEALELRVNAIVLLTKSTALQLNCGTEAASQRITRSTRISSRQTRRSGN